MKAKIWIIILAISILFSKNIYAENNKQCCQIATNISKIIFNYLNKDQNLNKINIISEYKDKKVNFQNFMFHYIEDVPKNTKDKLRYNLSFSPQKFEELLKYLDENKIETITFEDLKEIFEWKKKMPEKAVILGFDDWHLDHYTEAFPFTKKIQQKMSIFYNQFFPLKWPKLYELGTNNRNVTKLTRNMITYSFSSKSHNFKWTRVKKRIIWIKKANRRKNQKISYFYCLSNRKI